MEFDGTRQLPIDSLGLSQIYLSAQKLAAVAKWFDPRRMEGFGPLPVHDFGDGRYTLTDGHTRAYMAWKSGVPTLPVYYDTDEIVAGPTGRLLYRADLAWCRRFGLSHIRCLGPRILDAADYQRLWITRCDRSYDLLTQTSPEEQAKFQALAPELFLYGASEDLSTLYFEDQAGALFLYQNNTLLPEP